MSVFVKSSDLIVKFDTKFVMGCNGKDHGDPVSIVLSATEWRAIVRMTKIGFKTQQLGRYDKGLDEHPDDMLTSKPAFVLLPRPIHKK